MMNHVLAEKISVWIGITDGAVLGFAIGVNIGIPATAGTAMA